VIRKPILFQQTVQALENRQVYVYLDLGPSGTLANFVKYNMTKQSQSKSFPILTPFGQSLPNLRKVKDFLATRKILPNQPKVNTSTKTEIQTIERKKNKMITWVFPGQGSQEKGMGATLFDEFADLIAQADDILGYSIKKLCLEGPQKQLNQTQYTQPALYVVNALSYFQKVKQTGKQPNFVAGHSLGEYNALLAAGGIDFATGLKLVQKRGELMSQAKNGAMAAVLNLSVDKLQAILTENGLTEICMANYNTPSQLVISGNKDEINRILDIFEPMEEIRCVALNVSAAFHSRYMRDAQEEFAQFLKGLEFADLKIPLISNVTARPYKQTEIAKNLAEQITHQVNWVDSVRYLLGQGEMVFEEVGPGKVLTKLVTRIQTEAQPLVVTEDKVSSEPAIAQLSSKETSSVITPESLGSQEFKHDYNLKYAYVS